MQCSCPASFVMLTLKTFDREPFESPKVVVVDGNLLKESTRGWRRSDAAPMDGGDAPQCG